MPIPQSPSRPTTLVSFPRLGDALRARRLESGAGWLTISRADGVPFPDVLSDIERGVRRPDPDQIAPLVAAYGVGDARWGCGDELRVVFDRTETADIGGNRPGTGVYDAVRRLVECMAVCGMTLTARDVEVVAEALEVAHAELVLYCDDAVGERAERAASVDLLLDELVVPSTGLRIADCVAGTLLITRAAGARGVPVPPCCSLGELVTATTGRRRAA